jgi:hypothetical protein
MQELAVCGDDVHALDIVERQSKPAGYSPESTGGTQTSDASV